MPTHEGRGTVTPPEDIGGSGADQSALHPQDRHPSLTGSSIPSAGSTWLRGKKSSGRSSPPLTLADPREPPGPHQPVSPFQGVLPVNFYPPSLKVQIEGHPFLCTGIMIPRTMLPALFVLVLAFFRVPGPRWAGDLSRQPSLPSRAAACRAYRDRELRTPF